MGKQVDQGTRLETRTVKLAQLNAGRSKSRREPKTGTKHEPDVYIPGKRMVPALVWEHWRKGPGKQRRTALRTVTIPEDIWYELMHLDKTARIGYHVQCKSREKLSVRFTFEGLVAWMKGNA